MESSGTRNLGIGFGDNHPRLGFLVAFMQYAQRFFRPIQDLSEKYNILAVGDGRGGARVQTVGYEDRSDLAGDRERTAGGGAD
jgi:ABC-type multidrug transport system fused ATPase/permease subunit